MVTCKLTRRIPQLRKETSRRMSTGWNGREVTVPVPWGEIRGREWGSEDGVPWIALHGWLDNAGTFEPLVAHFPKGHRLLCIDLPGHGLSSHIPPGEHFNGFLDALAQVSRVAQHQVAPPLPRSCLPLPGKPAICTQGGQPPGLGLLWPSGPFHGSWHCQPVRRHIP